MKTQLEIESIPLTIVHNDEEVLQVKCNGVDIIEIISDNYLNEIEETIQKQLTFNPHEEYEQDRD